MKTNYISPAFREIFIKIRGEVLCASTGETFNEQEDVSSDFEWEFET